MMDEHVKIPKKKREKGVKPRKKENVGRRCSECTMSIPIEKSGRVWLWCMEYDKYCKIVAGNCKKRR